MNAPFSISHWPAVSAALLILLDAAVKSALVLGAAGLAICCLRRSSAATRHFVWFLAVASLLVLPLLSWTLPAWQVLPAWLDLPIETKAEQPPVALNPIVTAPPVEPGRFDSGESSRSLSSVPPISEIQPAGNPSEPPATIPVPLKARFSWWQLAFALWIAGTSLALVPMLLGRYSLWRLERSSRRETAESWLELLRNLLAGLNFRRAVDLLKTNRRRMPMTWGIFRPKLLLPEQSRDWPEERRRVVLLHELAHAQRWDYLTNLITQLACALYWFNPLVWLAARQMIAERERACDDVVLRQGAKPADYAEQILQIAAGLPAERFALLAGIAMARPSNLETRLRAILDDQLNRATLTRLVAISALALLTMVVVPVAMMRAATGNNAAINQTSEPQIASANWGPSTNGISVLLELDHKNLYQDFPGFGWDKLSQSNLAPYFNFKVHVRNTSSNDVNVSAYYPAMTNTDIRLASFAHRGHIEVNDRWSQWEVPRRTNWVQRAGTSTTTVGPINQRIAERLLLTGKHTVRIGVSASVIDSNGSSGPEFYVASNPVAFTNEEFGTVTDFETRKPIDLFTITPSSDSGLAWDSAGATEGTNGVYRKDHRLYMVLVEAAGYAPELGGNAQYWLNFKLRKDNGVEGTVLDPEGRPVARAQVAFQLENTAFNLGSTRFRWLWPYRQSGQFWSPSSGTDSQGRFSLRPAEHALGFIAFHERGFAERLFSQLPVGSNTTLRLQPWARIEGTLREGGRPLTNEVIGLAMNQPLARGIDLDDFAYQTNTDSAGRFVFTQVPSGEFTLYRQMGGRYQVVPPRPLPMTFVETGSSIERRYFPSTVKTEAGRTATFELEASAARARPDEPLAEFSGYIVDDETGGVITNVDIVLQSGMADPQSPRRITWNQEFRGPVLGKPGYFSAQTWKRWETWRILADGYQPRLIATLPHSPSISAQRMVVRLSRGGELRGVVFDHSGQPVPDAKVVLNRYQSARIVKSRPQLVFGGSTATTDSAGRFRLQGVDGTESGVVVMAPGLQVWAVSNAVPEQELRITLPRPAGLTVRYSIPGDSADGEIALYLPWLGTAGTQWDALANEPKQTVPNGGWLTVTNLVPGDYVMYRIKTLNVGDMQRGVYCNHEKFTLESGQSKSIEFVRTAGHQVRGQVVGLEGTEAAGALIYVRSAEATGEMAPSPLDALTCGKDGQFQTALLEPGTYTIAVEAYLPETPDVRYENGKEIRVIRSGIRAPAYAGSAKVTVRADAAPPPVRIELRPWQNTQAAASH